MDSLITQINRVLQQEDIEGLIQAGAPSDEYLSEAEAIALFFSNAEEQDVISLERAILALWENMFNLSTNDMNLRKDVIHRVATALQELRVL